MILREGFEAFHKRWKTVELLKEMVDSTNRVYCYRIQNKKRGTWAYFAAKGSLRGGELSIHKELLKTMKQEEVPVFVAVKSGDHFNFYRFTVQDIERSCWLNVRDGIEMVNFHIRHGLPLQEREQAHPVLEKAKEELALEFISHEPST